MKNLSCVAAVLGVCVLAAGAASAMEPSMPRSPKIFARIDANSDGKITVEELKPRAERRFARFDGDSNGEVTTAEIDSAFQKLIEQRRARILKRMDGDANGVVTRAELDAFVVFMLDSADSNHDGGVSLEEAQSFRLAKVAR
jgi:hypothetical protein